MRHAMEKSKKKATDMYATSFAYSSISSARLIPQNSNYMAIRMELNQRNFETCSSFKMEKTVLINKRLEIIGSATPVCLNNELLVAINDDGRKALIRRLESNDSNSKQKPCFNLEIWNSDGIVDNTELTSMGIHGSVYNENNFGCLVWSTDGQKLAYVAEAYSTESGPFHYNKKSESDVKDRGSKYVQSSHWGEVYSSIHDTVIVIYSLESKSFHVIHPEHVHICPAKVIWIPGTHTLVYNGYENKQPKLGLIHCTNRKGAIYCTNEFGLHTPVSLGKCYSSPRSDPAGKTLVWLERDVSTHHHGCSRMMKMDLKIAKPSVVIDIVDTSITIENGKKFYGIYCLELPVRCWSTDSKYIFFSTPKKNVITSYIVDIDTCQIFEISTGNLSTVILDVFQNFVLSMTSNLNFPSVLFGSVFRNIDDPLTFKLIHSVEEFAMLPDNYFVQYEFFNKNVDPSLYTAMYFGPKRHQSEGKVPVIVVPHGGPHACISDTFSSTFYFFAKMGYGVVIVNYHGSIGVGEKFVTSLLGNIGTVDVQDMQEAVENILNELQFLDQSNVMIYGGSHGGYLGTMLSAKYPDFYRAVAVRNAVVNIVLALWSSDIPDWAMTESGFPYENMMSTIVDKKMIEKMMNISPMFLAKSVVAPTLLLVGKDDLRVSPHHSYHYHKILQAKGVNTKLIRYDDNHSLSSVTAEMDSVINSILWFEEHSRK